MVNKFFNKIVRNLESKDIFYRYYKNKYTYSDLKIFILKLSNILNFLPKKRNKICIISDKCFELYATSLGVVLTKNIWVPISTSSPELRIFEIIEELKPDLFIIQKISTLKMLRVKNYLKKKKIKFITFDEIKDSQSTTKIKVPRVENNDVSMIFFTSGSTGKPKGVQISYKGFIHSLQQQISEIYKNQKKLVFGDYHDISFIISLNILFPCIYLKGIISPGIDTKDILFPIDHAIQNNVNTLVTVPTTINRVRNYYKKISQKFKLKILILCGEPFYYEMLNYLYKKNFTKNIYNCYGSTELSPWVFCYKFNKSDMNAIKNINIVPIGSAFKGVFLKIIDEILYIGGSTLSLGYLNNHENKESFKVIGNKNYYKTNDLVKLKEKKYFVLGRSDSIVKISGYRVELFEIEKKIRKIESVTNTYIFAKEIDKYEKYICACVESDSLTEIFVKNQLKKVLPNYMIPKQIKILKKFPINKNFKVNRVELKKTFYS